jgi:TRAP-type C4-dicarboxylate transport system permease small subunit
MCGKDHDVSNESRWQWGLRHAELAVNLIAGLLFLAIFATLVAQTSMRYVFRSPLTTSQEMATIAFVWLIFWTAACCLKVNDHIRFDLVYDVVPDWLKRVFMVLCNLLFMGIFVYAAQDTLEYLRFLERQFTASLRLTYQIAFFPYFLFFFLLPVKLALNVAGLIGPGWRSRL